MSDIKQPPKRSEISTEDTWDLTILFENEQAWEDTFTQWCGKIDGFVEFEGKLHQVDQLLALLEYEEEFQKKSEMLGQYASLKKEEDGSNQDSQDRWERYLGAASLAGQAICFVPPELLSLPEEELTTLIIDPKLERYSLWLERLARRKPHTLSNEEELILAMQYEVSLGCDSVFGQLSNVDMRFPTVENEKGEKIELSNSSYAELLQSPKQEVRADAFTKFYKTYESLQHTFAATLSGAYKRDIFEARVRKYTSSLDAALFPDNIPADVYDGLILSVREHLPLLHKYYDVRRRALGLEEIHQYDTYVPILPDMKKSHTWDQATSVILDSLAPLGDEYVENMRNGFNSRWCDKYENRGKCSGAFCSGIFSCHPFVLMNFKEDVLEDVFTLSHEMGHAMHSFYSSKNQPFPKYDYVIFCAEVASTFNEQLLARYLMDRATDKKERAYLLCRQIDAVRNTIIRQTMFAEFEKLIHEDAEHGNAMTLEKFRGAYRELLDAYFGENFVIDDLLECECFRIPHFYRAFYVYKYATGLSAAIALANKVLDGGDTEREAYLRFLASGCEKDPLDLLKDAGVDLTTQGPVDSALSSFGKMVDELDGLV